MSLGISVNKYFCRSSKYSGFLMLCVAGGYQLRLFDDFDANACLVITDSIRFLSRLKEAVGEAQPGWHSGNALVQYVDPVQQLSGR